LKFKLKVVSILAVVVSLSMLHMKWCISLWFGNQTPISRNKDELHVHEYDIKSN